MRRRKALDLRHSWHGCFECTKKLGGKVPPGGLTGVTVTRGSCPYCKKAGTLIPHCDFSWPKLKERAVFD